ncbi:hypothetical protein FRC10_003517 [Ceratobasidium sp. 414]|nr:hypothetical protein FRC10_003517 [Ceratobasidium sp. 414]
MLGEDEDALFHPSWEPAGDRGRPEIDGGNNDCVDVGGDVNKNDEPDEEEGKDEDQQQLSSPTQDTTPAALFYLNFSISSNALGVSAAWH